MLVKSYDVVDNGHLVIQKRGVLCALILTTELFCLQISCAAVFCSKEKSCIYVGSGAIAEGNRPKNIITFEEKLRPEDVVYGKDALKHYKFYLKMEKNVEKKKLETELEERLQEYDWKIAAIDEMILLAKDYYVNPKSKNASKWKELKRQVKKSSSHKIGHTEVRRKLGTLMEYRPYFTFLIIIAQIISFIVICGQRGLTDIGVEPRMTLGSDIQTFMGIETVHKWMAPNIWIGPSDSDLIGVGAVFAPCMREDIQLQLGQSRQNYSTDTPLGCCEVASRNVAGTTTKSECEQFTEGVGHWRGDVTCNQRAAKESGVRHTMKPCCLGVKGQCRLLSHRHCVFLGGTFYQFGPEHCTQVMCLENVCRPGKLAASEVLPWQPESPSQWWRIPLSLLYHHGIIELVFVVAAQWILLSQIEFVAGWLRMLLIYLLSGTASLLTSAVFLPYQSHVGAVGAICGMTGVVLVELIHFWRLVHRPLIEVAKFLCAIVLMLFLGTLPYLDTFGMLTGFIVGILSGIILLPYITFGKWHTQVRVALIMVSLIVLFVLCYFLLQMFFTVQSVEGCEACRVLNCVPYTEKMCDSDLWQQF